MQLGHSPSSIPIAHAHAADGRVFIHVTGEVAPMGFKVTYGSSVLSVNVNFFVVNTFTIPLSYHINSLRHK